MGELEENCGRIGRGLVENMHEHLQRCVAGTFRGVLADYAFKDACIFSQLLRSVKGPVSLASNSQTEVLEAMASEVGKVQMEEEQAPQPTASKVISYGTASHYRKELAEGEMWQNQGKGKPKVLKTLTTQQIAIRKHKIAEYEALQERQGKRQCVGKWNRQLDSIDQCTKDIKEDTSAIKEDTTEIRKEVGELRQ